MDECGGMIVDVVVVEIVDVVVNEVVDCVVEHVIVDDGTADGEMVVDEM